MQKYVKMESSKIVEPFQCSTVIKQIIPYIVLCLLAFKFFYAFNIFCKCETLLHLNGIGHFNYWFQNIALFIFHYHGMTHAISMSTITL
jgi:hypothetical protein